MPLDSTLIARSLANWQYPQVAIPDPVAQIGRLQALQHGIAAQQLQNQQLQSGAIDLKEKQQQISGQDALAASLRNHASTGADGALVIDHAGVIQDLSKSHPELILGYQKSRAAQDEADTKLKTAKLQQNATQIEMAARAFAGATDQPGWDHALGTAAGFGVDTAKLGIPAVYSPDAQKQVLNLALDYKDKLTTDIAAASQKTQEATARAERVGKALDAAAGATSQTNLDALRRAATAAGATPDELSGVPPMYSPAAMTQYGGARLTPAQRGAAAQATAEAAETKRVHDAQIAHQTVEEQQGKQRLGFEGARLGLERQTAEAQKRAMDPYGTLGINKNPVQGGGLHGEEFLKTLPPAMQGRLKQIAEGREAVTDRFKNSPEGKAIMTALSQYDPEWSEQRAQIRKAFTTGPDGRNIGNLNTAVVHLDQMHEAAKAMKNGTWQPGNRLYNSIAATFGAAAPTDYQFVMNAFAGEAASALKGNATDPEIAHVISTLGSKQSPEQAEGVSLTGLHTLGAKLNTYHERYQQQSQDNTTWSPVLPSARDVFTRYGLGPMGAGAAAAGGGKGGAAAPAAKPIQQGDTVMYNGKAHKVIEIKPDGKYVLDGEN